MLRVANSQAIPLQYIYSHRFSIKVVLDGRLVTRLNFEYQQQLFLKGNPLQRLRVLNSFYDIVYLVSRSNVVWNTLVLSVIYSFLCGHEVGVILKIWCVCGGGVFVFLVQISINRKVSVFRGECIINLVMFKISMIS